ncbi:MAG: adenylate/guanylate cyclase domain-containing protein [Lachnospiraceae bacterium]|nr:adenylate/guanylate cyclase domain-containing protein [Lachnospiraceae bacterium]
MKKNLKQIWIAFIPVIILKLSVLLMPFYSIEARLSDALYAQLNGTNRHIKLITVDEETLAEYGDFTSWSREKSAELIELLCADEECAPAVIGMDFLFVSEADEEADDRLVKACNTGNVVFASNLVYRGMTKQDEEGARYFDSWNVEMIEEPFEALSEVTESGFANVHIAEDGCVRYTKVADSFAGEPKASFAYRVYEAYAEAEGLVKADIPKSDSKGKFTFFYSGENGEYAHFSMKDVLDGTIPKGEFRDCIVLVGAYAPGFQDAYVSAIERGTPMYGVEIHANIIQALMEGKTAVALPVWIYLLIGAIIVYAYFLLAQRQKLIPVILEAVALTGIHMAAGRILAKNGYTMPQLYFLLIMFFIVIYFIIEKYFMEKYRRRKVLSTFKKYVAPQIVDKLAKDGEFTLKLGGEKRSIAVLFVDIRGFTPMSESLQPEEVVSILNEYLALTTASVLGNEGTLDKFIGDATMAVFNAPFDLDDYVYKAILTALAIRDGSDKLAERLQEQFGKTISYGIGVNFGEAVVGNIGCEFRMDYTAIGDTVNTAARLESRAKAGEILISEAVYQEVESRITAEPVGEMELKGKSKPVKVYRLIDIKEN